MLIRPVIRLSVILLALAGCAAPPGGTVAPAATTTVTTSTTAPAATSAPSLRPDLGPQWVGSGGKINWPDHDGFTATPVLLALPPGLLIDRFGSEGGRFFSPKGAGYGARALPYVCASLVYRVYRLEKPLLAWSGTAAPWFGEPGGATQLETDANAAQLVADGVIAPVQPTGAAPCPK